MTRSITKPTSRRFGILVPVAEKRGFGERLSQIFSGVSIASARSQDTLKIMPGVSSLHKGNAYWMAMLSKLVYWRVEGDTKPDEARILAELQKRDKQFTAVHSYNRSGSQAMFVVHSRFVAMVFRGTDELVDWLNNMKITKTEVECGTFHTGFYDGFMEIWSEMRLDYLECQAEQERPLFITGHSLGGAIANLAAAHCLFYDYPFVSVYTFGQPRALAVDSVPAFNATCQERYFRFQRHHDLVGYTPLSFAHFGHVGQCIYIDDANNLHNDPGWWFKFLGAIESTLQALGEGWVSEMISNHRMGDYLYAVERWRIGQDWGF